MVRIIAFVILSLPVILLSWSAMLRVRSHGFYRFFSWESILWLLVCNLTYWFDDPFCFRQQCSWILLIISFYLVVSGVILLKIKGKPNSNRAEKGLYKFEKTSELVDTGIYKYIRHPLYSSLIFLTWGIFLKQITLPLFIISVISTLFLWFTSLFDEKECISYFGDKYKSYMKRTKRFIPFVI